MVHLNASWLSILTTVLNSLNVPRPAEGRRKKERGGNREEGKRKRRKVVVGRWHRDQSKHNKSKMQNA